MKLFLIDRAVKTVTWNQVLASEFSTYENRVILVHFTKGQVEFFYPVSELKTLFK